MSTQTIHSHIGGELQVIGAFEVDDQDIPDFEGIIESSLFHRDKLRLLPLIPSAERWYAQSKTWSNALLPRQDQILTNIETEYEKLLGLPLCKGPQEWKTLLLMPSQYTTVGTIFDAHTASSLGLPTRNTILIGFMKRDVKPFRSKEEYVKALLDPRYSEDPEYAKSIKKRLQLTNRW